jgi:hypothetical protein
MYNIYIDVSSGQNFNEHSILKWIKKYIECYRLTHKEVLFSFFGDELPNWPLDKIKCIVEHFDDSISEAILPQKFCLDDRFIDFAKDSFVDFEANSPFLKVSLDRTIFKAASIMNLWKQNINTLIAHGILVRVNILLDADFVDAVSPETLLSFLKISEIDDIDFVFKADKTTVDRFDKWLNDFYVVNNDYAYVVLFNNIKDGRYFTQKSAVIKSDQTITLYSGLTEMHLTVHDELNKSHHSMNSNVGCYICDLYSVCKCLSYRNQDGCMALKHLINNIKTTER